MAANKLKRVLSLFLCVALMLAFSACSKDEPQDPPGLSEPNTPLDPEPGTVAEPGDDQGGSEPGSDSPGTTQGEQGVVHITDPPLPPPPNRDGNVWEVDLAFLEKNSYTLDLIFLCGNDTLLLFASPLNDDGTLSEKSVVFSYSLNTGRVFERALDLDIVGIYPDCVYDDGTVSVVTLNSETYAYKNIVFIDPKTLETSVTPLSGFGDLMGLRISPDKRYAALSTFGGLYLYDIALENLLFSIESVEGDDPEGLDDYRASPTEWSSDSSMLAIMYVGYEWELYPAILHVDDWSITPFEALAGKSISFLNEQELLCSEWYTFLPASLCDRLSGESQVIPFAEPSLSGAEIMDLRTGAAGSYIGLSYMSLEGDTPMRNALIADPHTGEALYLYSLPCEGEHYIFFEQLLFTPDGKTMVLCSSSTIEIPKRIYICDFNW